MKSEEIRNGVRIRKHFATSTKISEDGLFVEKEFIDKQDGNKLKTYNPKIKVDNNGLRYIVNGKIGTVYIQDLVADCFCAPKPNDGNYYVLVHKDGNLQNDHYKNLEWRLATTVYPTTTAKTVERVKLKDGLIVKRNGTIYQNRKKLTVGTAIGNGDMDMIEPAINPFVEYKVRKKQWKRFEWERKSVDELMEEAGYVNGNKKQFEHPVILHRDNDWLNFDSDNLEWTDYNDPRYKEYHNRAVDEKNRLGREWNGEEKWSYMEKDQRFRHI